MKALYRNVVRMVLCTGLLLTAGVVASAQEPSTQQASPAPDNTKVNERDRNQNEPTADQQKDNRSDRDITQQIRQSIMKRQIALHICTQRQDRYAGRSGNTQRAGAIRGREESD